MSGLFVLRMLVVVPGWRDTSLLSHGDVDNCSWMVDEDKRLLPASF